MPALSEQQTEKHHNHWIIPGGLWIALAAVAGMTAESMLHRDRSWIVPKTLWTQMSLTARPSVAPNPPPPVHEVANPTLRSDSCAATDALDPTTNGQPTLASAPQQRPVDRGDQIEQPDEIQADRDPIAADPAQTEEAETESQAEAEAQLLVKENDAQTARLRARKKAKQRRKRRRRSAAKASAKKRASLRNSEHPFIGVTR